MKTAYDLLIPCIYFNKTKLGRTDIERITGWSAKYIVENKIGPGASIEISKLGDVMLCIKRSVGPI